ncbi:MAG: hypothetical protein KA247_05685 [Bacteroidetes bacterium]|nr:hypothetical protein [Bacteroidota bacterium]
MPMTNSFSLNPFRTRFNHSLRITIVAIAAVLVLAGCNFLNDPPEDLAILSVSPNPFSDTVKIVYSVVSESSFDRLRIVITDRNNVIIETLVDETPKYGTDTIRWSGKKLTGGFYYLEMLGWFGDEPMSKVLIFREGTP